MLLELLVVFPYAITVIPEEVFYVFSYIDELIHLFTFYIELIYINLIHPFLEILWTNIQKPELFGSEIDYLATRGEEIMTRINATRWELVFNIIFTPTVLNALSISAKFILGIVCLIFARGGIPRFRFDYLTKLGWIRFLSLVLVSFLIQILILALN